MSAEAWYHKRKVKIPKIKYGVPRIPQNCLTVKDGLSGSNPSMPFLLGVLRFTQPYFNQLLEVVKRIETRYP